MTQRTLTAVNADPLDPADTYPERVEAASTNVEDLRSALDAAIELRDTLIVAWREAGATNRQVARKAHLSEARIITILARH